MPRPDDISDLVSLVSLAALCVLALRKLVLMDGLLMLRVLLLSVLLWVPVVYLFLRALPTFNNTCLITFDGDGAIAPAP